MLRIRVNTASAEIIETEPITAGRVGLQCALTFDSAWDGLAKTVVVSGVVRRDKVLVGDEIEVPGECLVKENFLLRIGVVGKNGDGTVVIPTVWTNFGKILPSAEEGGETPAEPTPDVVAQIQQNSANALLLAQRVMQKAENGEFNGTPGAPGAPGAPGTPGSNGASAYELAVEHGYTGTEVEWLESLQGDDGFAPEVTIEQIDGGHRVTITSADYPEGQSFDVMNGQGGGITVDDEISTTSENPVQNKVIKAALDEKANASDVPTKTSDLQNDSGFQTASQVESAIDQHLSAVYKAAGSVASISALPSPSESYLGYVYDVAAAFTTTSDFVEGAGVDYPAGTDVAIIAVQSGGTTTYKYDAMSGFVDLSGYIAKPANPAVDDFLCWNGTIWAAKTVPNANGVNF